MENKIRSSKIYEDIAQTITSNFNSDAKKNDFILNFFCYLVASRDIKYSYIKKMSESTNESLFSWIKQNLKVKGKVVYTSEGIGIIQDISSCHIIFGVLLNNEGDLLENIQMSPSESIREATEEEMNKLQAEINRRSLRWSIKRNMLCPEIPIKNGKFVRVSLLGKKSLQGIFKEINNNNEIVLYVKFLAGEGLKYSLNEIVGNASFFQIQRSGERKKELLLQELEKKGIKWNGYKKRIEPISYELRLFQKYFYINDFGEIVMTEKGKERKDKRRHDNGNFFSYRKNAEDIIVCFKKNEINPEIGDIYFYINDTWEIREHEYKDSTNDKNRLKCGNFFLDKEKAEKTLNELIEKRNLQLLSSKL